MLDRRASLSIEVLLACMIWMVCSMLSLRAFELFVTAQKQEGMVVVDQGIMAVQELVALSEWVSVNEDSLTLLYHNKEVVLRVVNGRLIRSPGTVIYINAIDSVSFLVEDELLHLRFGWRGKEYDYVIGKKEWWRDWAVL